MSDDFDWSADNPDVVTQRQNSIAVYENVAGCIVIRREAEWDENDDPIILVSKEHAPALAQAILRVAAVAGGGAEQQLLPPPLKDPTNAERQRRFRNRNRDDRYEPLRNGETLELEVPSKHAS